MEIARDELEAKLDRDEDVVLVEALPPMYYEDALPSGGDQHAPRPRR